MPARSGSAWGSQGILVGKDELILTVPVADLRLYRRLARYKESINMRLPTFICISAMLAAQASASDASPIYLSCDGSNKGVAEKRYFYFDQTDQSFASSDSNEKIWRGPGTAESKCNRAITNLSVSVFCERSSQGYTWIFSYKINREDGTATYDFLINAQFADNWKGHCTKLPSDPFLSSKKAF